VGCKKEIILKPGEDTPEGKWDKRAASLSARAKMGSAGKSRWKGRDKKEEKLRSRKTSCPGEKGQIKVQLGAAAPRGSKGVKGQQPPRPGKTGRSAGIDAFD